MGLSVTTPELPCGDTEGCRRCSPRQRGVWRRKLQWDGVAQGPPNFPSYSSSCPRLGWVILGPPGSMATLLPQSPFSTQAATTMAKSWQDWQEPTAGEHPLAWAGQGGHARPLASPTNQLNLSPRPPGCSRAEQHRARGAPFLPKTPSAEKERGASRWVMHPPPQGRGSLKAHAPLGFGVAVLPQGAKEGGSCSTGKSPHLLG